MLSRRYLMQGMFSTPRIMKKRPSCSCGGRSRVQTTRAEVSVKVIRRANGQIPPGQTPLRIWSKLERGNSKQELWQLWSKPRLERGKQDLGILHCPCHLSPSGTQFLTTDPLRASYTLSMDCPRRFIPQPTRLCPRHLRAADRVLISPSSPVGDRPSPLCLPERPRPTLSPTTRRVTLTVLSHRGRFPQAPRLSAR